MKVVLDKGAYMPERAHPNDAGLDLRTPFGFRLWPTNSISIDTGVHVQLPAGTYGKIESKSGLNVNQSIVCCGGVIDENYTGSIVVKIYNFGERAYDFKEGDKIAQMIIQPYWAPDMEQVDTLDATDRGDAGFGSTGR